MKKEIAGTTSTMKAVSRPNKKPPAKGTTNHRTGQKSVVKKNVVAPSKVAPLNMVTLTQAEFDSILSTIGQLKQDKGIYELKNEILIIDWSVKIEKLLPVLSFVILHINEAIKM